MKTMILASLLLLTACGAKVDPEFYPSIKKFADHFGRDNAGIDVVFGTTPAAGIAGYCNGSSVTVDRTWWSAASNVERDLLIVHELGHCVLGYEHDQNLKEDGCPESFMYSGLPSEACFNKYGNALLDTYTGTDPGNSNIPK